MPKRPLKRTSPSTPTPRPWSCRHIADRSEILAPVGSDGTKQVIAATFNLATVKARANAELIVQTVNQSEQATSLIAELAASLDLCLKSGTLTWEAEQEAELVSKKACDFLVLLGKRKA